MARVNKLFIDMADHESVETQLLSKDIIRMKNDLVNIKAVNKEELDQLSQKITDLNRSINGIDIIVKNELSQRVNQMSQDGEMNIRRIKEDWRRDLKNLEDDFKDTLYREVQMQSEKVQKERDSLVSLYRDIQDVMDKAHLQRKMLVISDIDVDKYGVNSLRKSFEKIKSEMQTYIQKVERTYNKGKSSLEELTGGDIFAGPMLDFLSSTKSLFQLDRKNKQFIEGAETALNKLRLIVNKKITNLEKMDTVHKHNEVVDRFEDIKNKINKKYSDMLREGETELKDTLSFENSPSKSDEFKNSRLIRLKNELKNCEERYNEMERVTKSEEKELHDRILRSEDEIMRSKKVIDFNDNTIVNLENRVKKLSSLVMGRKRYEMLKEMNIMDLDIEVNPEDNDQVLLMKAEEKMKLNLEKYSKDPEIMQYTLEEHREHLYAAQREIDKYYIMNANYKIGNKKHREEITNEDFVIQSNNRSIAIIYKPEIMKETVNLVKYMVQQTMNQYHPTALRVNILNCGFDQNFNNLQVITDKIDEKSGKLVKGRIYASNFAIQEEISNIVEKQRKSLSDMQRKGLIDKDFRGMLSDKRLKGSMMDQYTMNIIVNTSSKDEFRIFSNQSEVTGITNIEFFDFNQLYDIDDSKDPVINQEGKDVLRNYTIVIEPIRVYDSNKGKMLDVRVLDTREGIKETVAYNIVEEKNFSEWGTKLQERFFAIPKTGYTTEDYIERHCKEFFKASAEEGVQLHFGPKDGDMSVPGFLRLDGDSDNVHLFIAGTTGGGKSNTLSVMINMLKVMYPPSQLSVIYFDFKIVEVMMHAKPYKMPHCVAMCGTDCGDYIKSLMEYVVRDMDERLAFFKNFGSTNLKDCRKIVKKEIERLMAEGNVKRAMELKEKLPTRTILLVDEAAQAFQMDESVQEAFKSGTIRLAQLARAAGIHMVYVSQDPSRMPDEVMNNFKARACTKANKEVSTQVLKNDFASWPEHDILGFFCSNNNGGDPEFNAKYIVPFNDADFSTPIFSKIALELATTTGEVNRDPVIFDQDELLLPFKFQRVVEHVGPPRFERKVKEIYLGEPVKFTMEPEMSKLTLYRDAKQHITIVTPTVRMKENLIRRIYEGMKDEHLVTYAAFLKDRPFWFSFEKCFGMDEYEFLDQDNVILTKDDLKESSLVDGLISLADLDIGENNYDDEEEVEEDEEEEEEVDEDVTTLIFVFDSDVLDYRGGYGSGELMQIFSEASSKGVHVVFVESGLGRSIGEPYVNYVLASAITDTEFPRIIRDGNKSFVKKWVKEGEGTETFKPLSYN